MKEGDSSAGVVKAGDDVKIRRGEQAQLGVVAGLAINGSKTPLKGQLSWG